MLLEDRDFPALLRGLDGTPLESAQLSTPWRDHSYVLRPGRHVLWLLGAPYSHPLLPQRLHCYRMELELKPGGRYRLEEDRGHAKARLRNAGSGKVVASGALVDTPWVFLRACNCEA